MYVCMYFMKRFGRFWYELSTENKKWQTLVQLGNQDVDDVKSARTLENIILLKTWFWATDAKNASKHLSNWLQERLAFITR